MVFRLNEKLVSTFKDIFREENIHYLHDTYYGGKRFGFEIPEYVLKENPSFLNEFELSDILSYYIQLITRTNPISDEFIKKFELQQGHINLIRKARFHYDNMDEKRNPISQVWIAYKRPFGNSGVLDDVLEEFDLNIREDEFDDDNEYYKEKARINKEYGYLLDESMDKIRDFLLYAPFDPDLEAKYHYNSYTLTTSYYRKKKIKNLNL